jgi:ABC-type molybdate transport system substrate-binding protein
MKCMWLLDAPLARGMTASVAGALSIIIGSLTMPPAHADTIHLYSAGSLKAALTDVAKAYEEKSGNKVEATWGASGLLKDKIAGGAKADVFTSANMQHPQALHDAGKSGPVLLFARNTMCALVRPGLAVDTASLPTRMLDPNVKLGTSTPKADPSGDYAFEIFKKAEAIKPGARAALEAKALLLTGGPGTAQPPAGRTLYGWLLSEGRADMFLTYCTNALVATKENPGQQMVALPDNLSVGADYGMTVMNGTAPAAKSFADYIMSEPGQIILERYGFPRGK